MLFTKYGFDIDRQVAITLPGFFFGFFIQYLQCQGVLLGLRGNMAHSNERDERDRYRNPGETQKRERLRVDAYCRVSTENAPYH